MNDNEEILQGLEKWLFEQDATLFPPIVDGEASYHNKYKELKRNLIDVHNNVEKGALLESINKWKNDIQEKIMNIANNKDTMSLDEQNSLRELLEHDNSIYLNQHGVGHVDKVINKAEHILSFFKEKNKLTAFEVFILLCAIQIHDIGNVFGRDGHEKNSYHILEDKAKLIIRDSLTKRIIGKIAQVHGGKINGNQDTISTLGLKNMLLGNDIRECLLAALLRFADELADDSNRADLQGLESNNIPPESIIYHEYSKTLHTVIIKENEVNHTLFLQLEYFIAFDTISKRFIKNNKDILLIDEIFNRTKKIERERRYCMRFFSQYIQLNEIKVGIEIASEYDLDSEIIEYTLNESGYPTGEDIKINFAQNTGEEILENLRKKGWKV
jgi:hypothetical protein